MRPHGRRVPVSTAHANEQLDRAVETFTRAGRRTGVIDG